MDGWALQEASKISTVFSQQIATRYLDSLNGLLVVSFATLKSYLMQIQSKQDLTLYRQIFRCKGIVKHSTATHFRGSSREGLHRPEEIRL